MHAAHRVVVHELRRALEGGLAGLNFYQGEVQRCTNLRLRQLMRRVAQLYDLEMAKAGLKTTQYSLLSHVLKLGPLRPGELAQSMKFSASTLTRNLKPLIDAGWVELAAGTDAR